MLRKLFLAAVLVLAAAGYLYAGQDAKDGLELKIRTNGEFLKAAAKIVSEEKSTEATAILKLAEGSRDEALKHLRSGEYELARKDIDDSTTKAAHAIVLSRNSHDNGVKDMGNLLLYDHVPYAVVMRVSGEYYRVCGLCGRIVDIFSGELVLP